MLHQNKYFYIKYHSWAWSLNICVSMYIQYIYISKAKLENTGDMSAAEFYIIDRKKMCFSKSENCFSTSTLVTIGSSEPTIPFLSVKKWPDWWCPNPPGANQPPKRRGPVPRSRIRAMNRWQQNLNPRVCEGSWPTCISKHRSPRHVETSQKTQVDDLPWIYTKNAPPLSSWCFLDVF